MKWFVIIITTSWKVSLETQLGYYLQNCSGRTFQEQQDQERTVVTSPLSPVTHIISLIIIAVFQVKYQRQEIKYRYLDSKFGLH